VELVNDELGLMAALAGTPFIIEGEPLADPIAAVIVATIIAVNAAGLFRENFSMLMGGHPGKDHIRHLGTASQAEEEKPGTATGRLRDDT